MSTIRSGRPSKRTDHGEYSEQSADIRNLLGVPQNYFYLSRACIDIPTGRSTYTDNLYRFVVGLDGKFRLLAGQWNWEASGNWGRSHALGKTIDINTQNFFNALGAITADNPNGVPCLAGLESSPFPTRSETCAPFNPFGVGQFSKAALDYVTSNITNISNNRQFVFNVYVSGPLFKLPGGDLDMVAGVEHRAEGTYSFCLTSSITAATPTIRSPTVKPFLSFQSMALSTPTKSSASSMERLSAQPTTYPSFIP